MKLWSTRPNQSSHRKWAMALAMMTLVPVVGLAVRSQVAMAQTNNGPVHQSERVLSVTGIGMRSIPTTLTQVELGVNIEARTAQAAQQQAAEQSTAVIEWLRSQDNVQRLETSGISLNPRYDYSNNRQTLTGYQATNTVSFRVPTAAAGPAIDEAVSQGATQINGISFVAEDDVIAAARQQALASAVEDAQQQADTVLSSLGLSPAEIVNISIGSASAPVPRPVAPESRLADSAASTIVLGQEQTINGQVTLYIRY
ncbi:SIMPL domain-containing protein [cf. Phormidesmis sp. LEGE 11477]|uniref:SIMPL domain-containing protein n=1 Tax=cf. Phormidesmis sp. LEGE 11477 TaxID=1828680 RepID=UPI00187EEAF9|nr:SIMPL domain-containing protein [cf. Phormidesmis sp. LEGE 11477]MBE9060778.1 SIMPL domain-containing protein [cf. Phormidesmis sp. LEGE 11477]